MMTMNFDNARNVIAETLGCDDRGEAAGGSGGGLPGGHGADDGPGGGVAIADDAMPGLKTVGDVMNYLSDN